MNHISHVEYATVHSAGDKDKGCRVSTGDNITRTINVASSRIAAVSRRRDLRKGVEAIYPIPARQLLCAEGVPGGELGISGVGQEASLKGELVKLDKSIGHNCSVC